MRKGILLLGGSGMRFRPITKILNKHLIPILNRPIFYYSLSCLMLSNIREINIVSDKNTIKLIKKIIGNGSELGLKLSYTIQKKPGGIPEGIKLSKNFIGKSRYALMLGDNFFYSDNLIKILGNISKKKHNTVISYRVEKPENFGVLKHDKKNKVIEIIEKPKNYISNLAVTGLYFYENYTLKLLKKLKKSARGEYEISDFNNLILSQNKLKNFELGRGSIWLDSGTPNDCHKTSQFVKIIEERTGKKIGMLEEVAYNMKFIGKNKLIEAAKKIGLEEDRKYLLNLLS